MKQGVTQMLAEVPTPRGGVGAYHLYPSVG